MADSYTLNLRLTIEIEDDLAVRDAAFRRFVNPSGLTGGTGDRGLAADALGSSTRAALSLLLTHGLAMGELVAAQVPTGRMVALSATPEP